MRTDILVVGLFCCALPVYWLIQVIRTRIPREKGKKYSGEIHWQVSNPFARRWESLIDSNDLPVFKTFRKALVRCYWACFAAFLAFYSYLLVVSYLASPN